MGRTESERLLSSGIALQQSGRLAEALAQYRRAVRADYQFLDARLHLAICQHELGQYEDAERNLRTILAAQPLAAPVHMSLGNTLRERGRIDEAIDSYERAVAIAPQFALALFNLGTAYEEVSRHVEAIGAYDRALALGTDAAAFGGRGNCRLALGDGRGAIADYEEACRLEPNESKYVTALRLARGQYADALPQLEAASRANPADHVLQYQYVRALILGHQLAAAAGKLEEMRASAAAGEMAADILASLSWVRAALGDPDAGLAVCRQALARLPQDPFLRVSEAFCLQQLGLLSAARQSLEQALAVRPDMASARMQLALIDLLEDLYPAGFANYEYRWLDGWMLARPEDRPQWRGAEPLQGRRLFVYAEQGLGDTLQFARFLKPLLDAGNSVVLEAPSTLHGLMRRSLPGLDAVTSVGQSPPPHDLVCPLMSLPLALGTTIETIPPPLQLTVDLQRLEFWKSRICGAEGLRIGISWTGSSAHNLDTQRSMRLRDLDPVLRLASPALPVQFIALQKDTREVDAYALHEYSQIATLSEPIADLDDTAALIALCDVVICVDTAVAHLAASMGADTRILVPYAPDWRWGLGRSDCPWYPTVRLYRQTVKNDWSAPVAELRDSLALERAGITDHAVSIAVK